MTMAIILYITGGIALLALAWLFISLASTFKAVKDVVVEVRGDLSTVLQTVEEVKAEILPILGNVNNITANVTSITNGLQTQMISVHETIDDTLDVVRGTIDDIERLKNQLVATVEGPVALARATTEGTVGTIFKGVGLISKFFSKKNTDTYASTRPTNGTAESYMKKSDGTPL